MEKWDREERQEFLVRPPLIRQRPHMTGASQQEHLEVGKKVSAVKLGQSSTTSD